MAQTPAWGTEWPCRLIGLFCFPPSSRKTGTSPPVPSGVCAAPGLFLGVGVTKYFKLSTTHVLLTSPVYGTGSFPKERVFSDKSLPCTCLKMVKTGRSSGRRPPQPKVGAPAAAVCLSSDVRQSLSCSWRRLQNGQCVLTSKVAGDHTLSKHCHTTRHVGAWGRLAAGSREGRQEPAHSTGLASGPAARLRGPGTVRGLGNEAVGLGWPWNGELVPPNALSVFLKVPPPAAAAVLGAAKRSPAAT